jgi:hypothetical protein
MIFKLQKPLGGDFDEPEVLAYNKTRKVELFIPMKQADIDELFGDTVKQYWEGKVTRSKGGKNLILDRQVEEQDW